MPLRATRSNLAVETANPGLRFASSGLPIRQRDLGCIDYTRCWQAMQEFTLSRDADAHDEIWLVEHAPVFTLGLSGKAEHILDAGSIPVVKSDRGGQVTYHGPGQAVIYLLLDLRRRGLGIKELVRRMEQAVIDLLASYQVNAERRAGAPGVYVREAKVAALGLRVRRNCCYHGVALNVDLDLQPFSRINPCGYAGLRVTSTRELGIAADRATLAQLLTTHLLRQLDEPR